MTRFGPVVVLMLWAAPCLGAEAVPADLDYTAPSAPAAPSALGLVLRLIGLTAAMLLLCGGVVWVARRNNRAILAKGETNGRLRLKGTLSLDRHCAVHLMQVDELVVAITTDMTGLRSMVVLSEPFEAVLNAAEAPVTEPPRAA